MKPAPFGYLKPTTSEAAIRHLAEAPGAVKILAGGQSLMPLLNLRLSRPEWLLDINGCQDLQGIAVADDTLTLGALTRHHDLETDPLVRRHCPLLAEAAQHIGHMAIRYRGTLGGSLAHADPSAELPTALVALGGSLVLRSLRGERAVSAGAFFQGYLMTELAPDEILTAVRVPVLPPRTGSAFVEVARRHGDFAIVGVAAGVVPESRGRIDQVYLAVGGVGPAPFVPWDAVAALAGRSLDDVDAWNEAAEAAALAADPEDAPHLPAGYRRDLVRSLVRRALQVATSRAGGETDGSI